MFFFFHFLLEIIQLNEKSFIFQIIIGKNSLKKAHGPLHENMTLMVLMHTYQEPIVQI